MQKLVACQQSPEVAPSTCIPSRILRIWNPEGTSHFRRLDSESPQSRSGKGASYPLKCPGSSRGSKAKPGTLVLGAAGRILHTQASRHSAKGTLVPHRPPKATLSADLTADARSSTPVTPKSPRACQPRRPLHSPRRSDSDSLAQNGFQAPQSQPQIQTQASFPSYPFYWLPFC